MAKTIASYRVEAGLLAAVRMKADKDDDTVTDVIHRAFEAYIGVVEAERVRANPVEPAADQCKHPRARRQKGLCMACGNNVGQEKH